jgi:BirA family transcriptional regulator, biotin operon repressor / biotin---[acetyl-CoA-carboxylase] ligase
VVSIGINVNVRPDQFPEEIRKIATSLRSETGQEIPRRELIIGLYENFAKWYIKLLQNGFDAIKEKWLDLTPMIGQNVQILFQNEKVTGKALDLADDGSLIILTADNETLKVSAGDATILKKEYQICC